MPPSTSCASATVGRPPMSMPEGTPRSPTDALADRRIEGVADRLVIDEALDELPEEFRAAVVLRDLCDLDYAEIAATLDVPVGTVKSRIARGRSLLASRVGNPASAAERPSATPPRESIDDG